MPFFVAVPKDELVFEGILWSARKVEIECWVTNKMVCYFQWYTAQHTLIIMEWSAMEIPTTYVYGTHDR